MKNWVIQSDVSKITKYKQLVILVFAFAFASISFAQDPFTAKIKDSESLSIIVNATVVFEGGGVTTDSKGLFVITSPKYPMILELSHVGYHPQTLIVNSKYESGKVITLIPKTIAIRTVNVVGKKIVRFFKDQNYYISDYILLNQFVLTIGFEQKTMNKGVIVLSSKNDEKLTSVNIRKPKKLFKDGFGNIHVFAGDSVFQVYIHNENILLLYPTLVENFSKDLLKYKFTFDNYFVFREISGEAQANKYYGVDTIAKEITPIKTIYQEELFSASDAAVRYIQWKPNWARKVAADPGPANAAFEVYVLDIYLRYKPIHSQIFKKGEELLIYDLENSKSHFYNKKLEETQLVKTNFPKHHQRKKQIIQDSETGELYWVYYQGNRVLLGEIDPESGQIVNNIETPSLPFIEKISICDREVWFLYQPRIGETSRSLFHMKY